MRRMYNSHQYLQVKQCSVLRRFKILFSFICIGSLASIRIWIVTGTVGINTVISPCRRTASSVICLILSSCCGTVGQTNFSNCSRRELMASFVLHSDEYLPTLTMVELASSHQNSYCRSSPSAHTMNKIKGFYFFCLLFLQNINVHCHSIIL